MKNKRFILFLIALLTMAPLYLVAAPIFTGPGQGGTGRDTSSSTGLARVNAGVWAVSPLNLTEILAALTGTKDSSHLVDGSGASRSLVAGDIPGLPASKITSGTISTAQGGTALDTSALTGIPKVASGTWSVGALSAADLPTHNQSATNITSGTLATVRGGTNSDSSAATGFAKVTAGVWSWAGLSPSDLPAHNQAAGNITTGTLATARGGTNLDTSASTGTARVDAGVWSVGGLSLADINQVALPGTLTAGNLTLADSKIYLNGSTTRAIQCDAAGNYTTAIGVGALQSNTTGSNNNASGYQSLYFNTTGSYNNASGYQSLYYNTTGNYNNASGYFSLYSNTTGSNNNASGYQSLYYNTTGNYNTANGSQSLFSNTTGSNNNASGYYSLYSNTTGNYNTASGARSLYSNTTGNYNTASGYRAGFGSTLQTLSNCSFFGYNSTASVDGITNAMALGNGASVSASNQVQIGNTAVTGVTLGGPTCALSVGSVNIGIALTLPSYTVSGLSAISSPVVGMTVCITDATSPTYLGTLTGGGSVKCRALYNGSAWVAD